MFRRLATRLFDRAKSPGRRPVRARPTSFHPRLEGLEDRLVPAAWDYTNLVQTLGGYPAAHPTHLYLEFKVFADQPGVDNWTTVQIQEILYRTSEIFAPFNVEVSDWDSARIGPYDQSSAGNTTIFIGPDASHVDGLGRKFATSMTPQQFLDYPTAARPDHRPNSDPYDLAYVDPFFQTVVGGRMMLKSYDWISQAIAREAGHTFGLVDVRTDGRSDPTALGAGTVGDIMSANNAEGSVARTFFADQPLGVTAFTWHSEAQQYEIGTLSAWSSQILPGVFTGTDPITTQDSFTFLRTVLGARPNDGEHHASDPSTLDPGVWSAEIPQAATLSTATTVSGTVSREGDFNVFRFDTTAYQNELTVDLAATSWPLDPLYSVYDTFGRKVGGALGSRSIEPESNGLDFPVQPNSTYFFVIGGWRGTREEGTFHLKVSGRVPVAHDQSFTTRTGWALDVAVPGLQRADTDPDHNPMTTHLGRPPAHGTVTYLYSNGSFEYMPAHGFAGTDSFTYTEWDLNGQSNVATVTITVTPNALSAPSPTYRVLFNQPLTTTTGNGLLAGYWDPNGRSPHVQLTANVSHGTLILNRDGSFTYRPNAPFRGTDTFRYVVTDDVVTSPEGLVRLIVGQPPVAMNLSYEVDAGTTLHVAAAQGLVGRNGDPVAVAHLVGPGPAGLALHADGSFTFRPPPRRIYDPTPYTFRYYVTNPDGTSGIATVTITVYPQDPIVHGGHGQPF
jgi:hypothetical protein